MINRLFPRLFFAAIPLLLLLTFKFTATHKSWPDAIQFTTDHEFAPGRAVQPAAAYYASRPAAATAAALPDPRLTPGAIDPRITQQNISSTICVDGYTKTVRPPFEVSNRFKHEAMALYHSTGTIHDYELDHLIPLELGGCPNCIKNLWPQPWASPGANEKDEIEHYLRDRVCHHRMTLSEAQHLISTNWYSVYLAIQR